MGGVCGYIARRCTEERKRTGKGDNGNKIQAEAESAGKSVRISDDKTKCDDDEESDAPLDYYGAAGHQWKHAISDAERDILCALGFRVRTETPHKLVLVFANTLREKARAPDWLDSGACGWHALLAGAWAAANDVMRLPEGVLFRAEDVACACISRAAHNARVPLPHGWAGVFGASDAVVSAVINALELLYAQPERAHRFCDLAEAGILDACGLQAVTGVRDRK